MSRHPKKSHLRRVCWPSICSYRDFSWGCLLRQVVSNLQFFWGDELLSLLLCLALTDLCASQTHYEHVALHHRMLEGQTKSIWVSLRPGHCGTRCYQQAQGAGRWFIIRFTKGRYHMLVTTYLIVRHNELRYCMKNTWSCEFTGTRHRLKVQLLLHLLLCWPASFLFLFFFLHRFPYRPWNCPMTHRYVFLLTLLFVYLVMLTNMKATCRIWPLKESLSLSI